ncbi:MAG: hypothetical protein WBC06_01670 [Chitinophagaceae bacterium]
MIVYCNNGFSLEVERGALFSSRIFSGLIYYFQDKSFGDSIKEIVFLMLSGDDEYLQHYGVGRTYRKKSESYGSIFVVDYKIVEELNDEELLRYYANELIKEANLMKDKKLQISE